MAGRPRAEEYSDADWSVIAHANELLRSSPGRPNLTGGTRPLSATAAIKSIVERVRSGPDALLINFRTQRPLQPDDLGDRRMVATTTVVDRIRGRLGAYRYFNEKIKREMNETIRSENEEIRRKNEEIRRMGDGEEQALIAEISRHVLTIDPLSPHPLFIGRAVASGQGRKRTR